MDQKEKLIAAYSSVAGRYPVNFNEILSVLTHPDVIKYAKAYLQIKDSTETCLKYQAPWNCALDAEATNQTIFEGWNGNIGDVMSAWCINCRNRLFGEDPGDAVPMDNNWLEDPQEVLTNKDVYWSDRDIPYESVKESENPWVFDDPESYHPKDVDGCGD